MIDVECSACGHPYQVHDKNAGRTLQCRRCGGELQIPEPSPEPHEAPGAEPSSPPTPNAQAHTAVMGAAVVATSGMAVAGLVLGIFGLCIPLVGVLALVLSLVAINRIDNPANRQTGRGMAVAGAIMGGVGIITGLVVPFFLVLLPAMGAARTTARTMQNNTQVRGIHQAMNIYASTNKIGTSTGRFPGLNPDGTVKDVSVSFRYEKLLDRNLFDGDYAIAPIDDKVAWSSGPITADNYSYSLLDVSEAGRRRDEWAETFNREAIIITDRNTGRDARLNISSIWTDENSGYWEGSTVFNDNSVIFSEEHTFDTRYGSASNTDDHLFQSIGTDDVKMIYSGE